MAVLSEDPELQRVFKGHRDSVTSVAFLGGREQAVSGSLDGTVMVWNFAQGRAAPGAFRFVGHAGAVHSVAYDPANALIASASADKSVRLWRPTAEGRSALLRGHTGAVRCCAFAQSGRLLATASDDKTVKVWSVPQQSFLCSLTGHTNWVRACELSPDARLAVSAGDDRCVRVWDLEARAPLHAFDELEGAPTAARFHPDGSCIVSGGSDGSVKVWDLRAGRLVQFYEAHAGGVTALSCHPSGSFLLTASLDGTLKVLDLREGSLFYTLHGHEGPALAAAFSPAGDQFLSAGADKQVLCWATNFDACLGQAAASAAVRAPAAAGSGRGTHGAAAKMPRQGSKYAAAVAAPAAAGRLSTHAPRPKTAATGQEPAAAPDTIAAVRPAQQSQATAGGDSTGAALVQATSVNTAGLPEGVADVLQALVAQLGLLSSTVAAMEERLTLSEDRGRRLEAALAAAQAVAVPQLPSPQGHVAGAGKAMAAEAHEVLLAAEAAEAC